LVVNYRTLGKTGFAVSEIGYGAWGIGGKQWLGGADDESVEALNLAIDRGLTFIDTALAYGDGHSEKLVGQVVRARSERIYVATKVPPKNRLWPARPGVGIEQVFPYHYIVGCTEQSLRNLKLDAIDLQQLHVWNPEWIERDEWKRAIETLKTSGKVRAFGVSVNDHRPHTALSIVRTGLIDCVQVIYNIFDQSPEKELFPLCQEHNVGVIARVPLDEGALTGRVDENTTFPAGDFREYYFRGDHKKQVVEHVRPLQHDLGDRDLPATALRFCITHPAVSTVIPGMRTIRHAEANCALSQAGPLDAETLAIVRRHAWEKNFYD
jgi:aryl-alcohol dehydrogenase-like predicted oxidoreductase